MDEQDDWEAVWDARAESLALVLGPAHDQVFHASLPFWLGGLADVVAFHHHIPGVVYVTAELTGKPGACYADYELMVCQPSISDWGARIISQLAPYTQEAYIGAGESMDIDGVTPSESLIKAFIFDTYRRFAMFGCEYDLRLCLGITKAELEFKMQHGAEELLVRLKHQGVYPYTDLARKSIPLDA